MKITKFTTFYKIELNQNNYRNEMVACQNIMDALSTIDYMTECKVPFCYKNDGKSIKIPIGVGDEWLSRKLNAYGIIHKGLVFPHENKKYFSINKRPFPEQLQVIKETLKQFKRFGRTQAILNMQTGRGKTFTATAIASELGCNILVLVKTHVLLNQWSHPIDGAFAKHTKLKPCHVLPMTGSRWFLLTYEGQGMGYKVFVTTHSTVRSILKDKGKRFLSEWFIKNKIGCKIFDEFDTEVDSMIELDFLSSVRYNIYLSATDFKNGISDNGAFQRMFKTTYRYGKELYTDKPNRKAIVYGYNTNPSQEEYRGLFNFKGHFVADKYMNMAIQKQAYFDILGRVIREQAMPIYELDKGFKIVIMTGKIDNCELVEAYIMKTFNIPQAHIGQFHSNMDKSKKANVLDKPFIVSISDSIGRGLDITKIKLTIDMEVYAGGSIFKQATGRNGRVGGVEGLYVKVVDKSVKPVILYFNRLRKYFDEEFKAVSFIDMPKTSGKDIHE